jgi:hypothetical protein
MDPTPNKPQLTIAKKKPFWAVKGPCNAIRKEECKKFPIFYF